MNAKTLLSKQIHRQQGPPMKEKANKLVVCADGFYMSVQASPTTYSVPRDNVGPYSFVEVGFPSDPEPMLYPYAEDIENPTDTVYAYVPKAIVTAVIVKHHGMVSGELPNGIPYLYATTAKNKPI